MRGLYEGSQVWYFGLSSGNRRGREGSCIMSFLDWTFADWLRIGGVWLVIFAVVGGIISQTSGGVSGRGFFEGMWKGVEWFLIVVVAIIVLMGVAFVMGMTTGALNTS